MKFDSQSERYLRAEEFDGVQCLRLRQRCHPHLEVEPIDATECFVDGRALVFSSDPRD